MKYHLDGEIRLGRDTEYSSLYPWCLQEFNEDGEKIGSDLIPYKGTVYFFASDLTVRNRTEITYFDFRGQKKGRETEERESIFGTLKSGWLRGGSVGSVIPYRMFRTSRTIEEFSFRIHKLTDDSDHHLCFLEGFPSYSLEDMPVGAGTAGDNLTVVIGLLPAGYDKLVEEIRGKRVDEFSVELSRVPGFYENWRPPITIWDPEHIKVLVHENEPDLHSIVLPENCDIDPPRLGGVKEFSFSIAQKTSF